VLTARSVRQQGRAEILGVSSIAGAVNVVLSRGKDDDQNWSPKAPKASLLLAAFINTIDPKRSSIRRHPAAVSGAETV
jgi:hypothetical protein